MRAGWLGKDADGSIFIPIPNLFDCPLRLEVFVCVWLWISSSGRSPTNDELFISTSEIFVNAMHSGWH